MTPIKPKNPGQTRGLPPVDDPNTRQALYWLMEDFGKRIEELPKGFLTLSLDDATGEVTIDVDGPPQAGSIRWSSSTTALPPDDDSGTAVNTDAAGNVTVAAAFTIARGETGHVRVRFYRGVDGAGEVLESLTATTTRAEGDTGGLPEPPAGGVQPAENVQAATRYELLPANVVLHVVDVTWDASPTPDIIGYFVEWKLQSDPSSAYQQFGMVYSNEAFKAALYPLPPEDYDIKITALHASLGSAAATIQHTVAPYGAIPSDVTGLTATLERDGRVTLAWNEVTNVPVLGYAIRAGRSTDTWDTAPIVVTTASAPGRETRNVMPLLIITAIKDAITAAEMRANGVRFFVKAVGPTGNVSVNAAIALVTNPKPTFASVTKATKGYRFGMDVKVSGLDTSEATEVILYVSKVTPFTPSTTNIWQTVSRRSIVRDEATVSIETGESKFDFQAGDTGYMILELIDEWSGPLAEAPVRTAEFFDTFGSIAPAVGMAPGEPTNPPVPAAGSSATFYQREDGNVWVELVLAAYSQGTLRADKFRLYAHQGGGDDTAFVPEDFVEDWKPEPSGQTRPRFIVEEPGATYSYGVTVWRKHAEGESESWPPVCPASNPDWQDRPAPESNTTGQVGGGPVSRFFDKDNEDFDDVPQGTVFRKPGSEYVDVNGRLVRVYRKGVEFDADDIESETGAQTKADGAETNAQAYTNSYAEKKILKQSTEPVSPEVGLLWIDTSDPNLHVVKQWSGSVWVKATPTNAAEIQDAYDLQNNTVDDLTDGVTHARINKGYVDGSNRPVKVRDESAGVDVPGADARKGARLVDTLDPLKLPATETEYSAGVSVKSKEPAEAGAEATTGKSITVLTDRAAINVAPDAFDTSGGVPNLKPTARIDGYIVSDAKDGAKRAKNALTAGFDTAPRFGTLKPMTALAAANRTSAPTGYSGNLLTAADVGTTATITVASFTMRVGSLGLGYGGGSITGLAFSTQYHIYFDDDDLSGDASPSYGATTNENTILNSENRVYVGTVTTPPNGGGVTDEDDPGGGIGGSCVAAESWIDAARRAIEIVAGDLMDVLDGEDRAVRSVWSAGFLKSRPCVRLISETGATLIVAHDTPITLRNGESIEAFEVAGHELYVEDGDGPRWEPAVARPVGVREVVPINLGGSSFLAGESPGARIATHNAKKIL